MCPCGCKSGGALVATQPRVSLQTAFRMLFLVKDVLRMRRNNKF